MKFRICHYIKILIIVLIFNYSIAMVYADENGILLKNSEDIHILHDKAMQEYASGNQSKSAEMLRNVCNMGKAESWYACMNYAWLACSGGNMQLCRQRLEKSDSFGYQMANLAETNHLAPDLYLPLSFKKIEEARRILSQGNKNAAIDLIKSALKSGYPYPNAVINDPDFSAIKEKFTPDKNVSADRLIMCGKISDPLSRIFDTGYDYHVHKHNPDKKQFLYNYFESINLMENGKTIDAAELMKNFSEKLREYLSSKNEKRLYSVFLLFLNQQNSFTRLRQNKSFSRWLNGELSKAGIS